MPAAPIAFELKEGAAEAGGDQDEELTDVEEGEEYKRCDCTDPCPAGGSGWLLLTCPSRSSGARAGLIPYKCVYDPLDGRAAQDVRFFAPGLPVRATVVQAIRDSDHVINIFNQYL